MGLGQPTPPAPSDLALCASWAPVVARVAAELAGLAAALTPSISSQRAVSIQCGPMKRCTRCQGSVLSQQFIDSSGRGTRWTCISCGEERELLDGEPMPTVGDLRQIFAEPAPQVGRPQKTMTSVSPPAPRPQHRRCARPGAWLGA